VPRFTIPTPEQVRSVLRESHALWGAGLSVADYVAMWEELATSPWGRARYAWRALVDEDGQVLSSLKLYRPMLGLDGATLRVSAIGAVFTPRRLRRRGLAATLIRECLDEAERDGDGAALLFTDIGTDYYRALGFTALPCEDVVGSLPGASAAKPDRGTTLRAMTHDDLPEVCRAHERVTAKRPIAVLRDRAHWEFLLLRAGTFFRRLDGSDLARRFMIAMESGQPVGYVVGVVGPGEWNLREAEAFDGDDATLSRILVAAASEAAANAASTVWGWIPRDLWRTVPSWQLRSQPRLRAIPMLRPLQGRAFPDRLADVQSAFIPYLDQF
jgi:predicted N-acetyltransferase YhbS